ncbi:MAG: class I SAM-dependent methyltransferase [Patescibacteria group bacterium]
MDLKATYNKIAQDWFKNQKEREWWNDSAYIFFNYLQKGDRILDVGCGAGLKTKYLMEKGFKVVGIDFSEEMIKLAKEYCPTGEFYVKDIRESLGLDIFDGIFAQAILLHIPKAQVSEVLNEFKNSIKDGGYLYLAVKEQRLNQKDEEIIKENDYGYTYERFFSFFTMPEIKNYLSNLNMKVMHDKIVPEGDTNWIVVIAQK